MIGRFLLGSGLGALVGSGLLALASVVSPAPVERPVATSGDAMPSAAEGAAASVSAPADPAVPEAPQTATPASAEMATAASAPVDAPAETTAETPVSEATPAVAAAAPDALTSPEAAPAPPVAPEVAEAPVVAEGPQAPATPEGDAAPVAAAAPAAAPDLPQPEAPTALAGTPALDEAAPATPSVDVVAPDVPVEPAQPDVLAPEAAPATAELPGPPPLTPEEEALLRQLAEGSPGNGAAAPGEAAGAPALAPEEGPDAEAAETIPAQLPADAPLPEVATTEVELIETDPALPSAAELPGTPAGVVTDRLPRIGSEGAAASDDAAAGSDTPLVAHARAFDNPEGKPAFAIVLIDDGADTLDRAALAGLPFAVSFALDPTHPKVADHAAIYRAAGQEVVMLASGLPEGAQAADVEVAMAAMARTLPESVAVMDLPEAVFQADRPLAAMVVAVVGGQGRGVLTWDEGLNAADQVARREDVPAAVAFRDLDGAGETAPVIRRYLDRAAFKAAQEGRVTVIGRARPETVAAILEWTVEGRAATVALAPLSAVLSVD